MEYLDENDLEWNIIVPAYARIYNMIGEYLEVTVPDNHSTCITSYCEDEIYQFEDACNENDRMKALIAVNSLIKYLRGDV